MYMEYRPLYRLSDNGIVIDDSIGSTVSSKDITDEANTRKNGDIILNKLNKIHNKDIKKDVPGLASDFFSKSDLKLRSQWLNRLVEELTRKLYVLLRFTCCLPLPKKVYTSTKRRTRKPDSATSTEVELKAPITFNCVEIPNRVIIGESKEKNAKGDISSIESHDGYNSETVASNPESVSKSGSNERIVTFDSCDEIVYDMKPKKGKLKGILKKLKKKRSESEFDDNFDSDLEIERVYRCGDKCAGECMTKKAKIPKFMSFILNDDYIYKPGESPTKKRRRITNFFNDIYTPCNRVLLDGQYSRYCVYHDLWNPKVTGEV